MEDLQLKYLGLIYGAKLGDEARATYWSTHGDPKNKTVHPVVRQPGPHNDSIWHDSQLSFTNAYSNKYQGRLVMSRL